MLFRAGARANSPLRTDATTLLLGDFAAVLLVRRSWYGSGGTHVYCRVDLSGLVVLKLFTINSVSLLNLVLTLHKLVDIVILRPIFN